MKKILLFFLCNILLITSIGHVAKASVKNSDIYSEVLYDGFELSWINNGKRDLLLSATDKSGTITFEYDADGYRTSKTNSHGETTYFAYDDSKNLTEVRFGTHHLEYTYDAKCELSHVTIDGVTYTCVLLDGSVHKLLDDDGRTIVEYQYENGRLALVYGQDEFGNRIDKTNDREFIGNLNRVTLYSYFFDIETGWYYCGRYYDVERRRFVDGSNMTLSIATLKQSVNARTEELSLRENAHMLYNYYINDSSFGVPIDDTSSNWYSGMTTIELLARLIYGENPFYGSPTDDRIGVAWTLWNRKMKNYLGDSILWSVATHSGQFSAICNASRDARCPSTTAPEWQSAVLYACYLSSAEAMDFEDPTAELYSVMPLPYGMTYNHTRFCDYDSAMQKLEAGTTLRYAVIAGYGSIGSTPESLEATYLMFDEEWYEINGYYLRTPGSTITEDVNGYYEKVNIFYCD